MINRSGGWHKSSYSGAQSECVEVNEAQPSEGVLMRDTKHRDLGHLGFVVNEWAGFLQTVRTGQM